MPNPGSKNVYLWHKTRLSSMKEASISRTLLGSTLIINVS